MALFVTAFDPWPDCAPLTWIPASSLFVTLILEFVTLMEHQARRYEHQRFPEHLHKDLHRVIFFPFFFSFLFLSFSEGIYRKNANWRTSILGPSFRQVLPTIASSHFQLDNRPTVRVRKARPGVPNTENFLAVTDASIKMFQRLSLEFSIRAHNVFPRAIRSALSMMLRDPWSDLFQGKKCVTVQRTRGLWRIPGKRGGIVQDLGDHGLNICQDLRR